MLSGDTRVVWGGGEGRKKERKVEIHACLSCKCGFVATKWKVSSY